MSTDVLIKDWFKLQKHPIHSLKSFPVIQKQILEEMGVLESLLDSGCKQIPGEKLNIGSLIFERKQLLRDIIQFPSSPNTGISTDSNPQPEA